MVFVDRRIKVYVFWNRNVQIVASRFTCFGIGMFNALYLPVQPFPNPCLTQFLHSSCRWKIDRWEKPKWVRWGWQGNWLWCLHLDFCYQTSWTHAMTLRLSEVDKASSLNDALQSFSHDFLTLIFIIVILIMKVSKETQTQFCLPQY